MNNVNNTTKLPTNYVLSQKIDLKKDNKLSLLIQIIFIIIAAMFVGFAIIFKLPIKNEFNAFKNIVITVGLVFLYMIVHELTHGVFIKFLSKEKPMYTFRFPFLTTGSNVYFNKRSFIIIALAPVIGWGTILLLALFVVPQYLFMSIYIVLGLNFAGSAGDYIQVVSFSKLSNTTLLHDDGNKTSVYSLKN